MFPQELDGTGAVLARYSGTNAIDEPLAMARSSATSFYNTDGLGSVTSLTSTTGAIAQSYAFDSFGKQTAANGSLSNPTKETHYR